MYPLLTGDWLTFVSASPLALLKAVVMSNRLLTMACLRYGFCKSGIFQLTYSDMMFDTRAYLWHWS